MAYTFDDIVELIRHHLVLSVEDPAVSDGYLHRLVASLESMFSRPRPQTGFIEVCEACGAWVYSELISPDGAGDGDGAFCCSDCRWGDHV